MREARSIQWARFPQCLLLCLVRARRSKGRREQIIEDGAPRTGWPDRRRNNASYPRLPWLHSPRHVGAGENNRSCPSAFYNACRREIGCNFFAVRAEEVGFSPIAESTVLPIVSVVDWKLMCQTVALSTTTRLPDAEKLEVLRRLDQFRHWHSLDEKRYCLVCGNLITGRQIQVAGGIRGNGPLRLSCPTQGCNSIPMDWVLPTDEILARVERLAAEERKASTPKPPAVTNGNAKTVRRRKERDDFVSRLLKFALVFKRYS